MCITQSNTQYIIFNVCGSLRKRKGSASNMRISIDAKKNIKKINDTFIEYKTTAKEERCVREYDLLE